MSSRGRITIEIDKNTKAQLQAVLKEKLSKISSYTDDVLPEYVLVMVGNGKTEAQVSEDLEAFLGKDNAKEFSRWLWETLLSPNFGLNAQNPPQEKEVPRKISSLIVPANRDDDIVGDILGEDRDDFNDAADREYNDRERLRERDHRERDRHERYAERERGRDRDQRGDDRGRPSDRHRDRARTSPARDRDRDRRDRDREREPERERERGREGGESRSLSSFIGSVRSNHDDRSRTREPDPERVREERAQRLRTSSSALPSRLIMSAVEQAAASTKRRASQTQPSSQLSAEEAHATDEPINKKRRPAREEEDDEEANEEEKEDRGVSFTITLDGLSTLSATGQKQKRARRVVEGQASAAEEGDEEEGPFALNAGAVEGLPTFEDTVQGEVKSKRKRCTFWPQCANGAKCPYYHPTENCKNFPNCPYGKQCLYIHPSLPCKFGVGCTRPNCNFSHPPPMLAAAAMSAFAGMVPRKKQKVKVIPCRNGFACTVPDCKYSHPTGPCKFGRSCTRGAMCQFSHAPPCRYGAKCTQVGCTFSHFAKNTTWTPAQDRSQAPIPPAGDRPNRSTTTEEAPATDNNSAAAQEE